jgi:hypothetical protein
LSALPPAAARSCQPPARVRCPSSSFLSCHPPPNCPVLCPPPHSSCRVARRPIASPSSATSTLALRVHPPPLIVLFAAHPFFYLFVVCWIGEDRTWSLTRCLVLQAPSLLSCYPPPACFASCSPATCLPYFLIVMY